MTVFKVAHLDAWARKIKKRTDLIVRQATHDVIASASRTRPGVMRGGTVQPGYVPRDTGFLAASLVSSLNGSTALTGEDSYIMVVADMDAGDVAEFGWTAAYARVAHYRGWMWVDVAANNWPRIVDQVVERAKAMS